jgi:hypothetical protein
MPRAKKKFLIGNPLGLLGPESGGGARSLCLNGDKEEFCPGLGGCLLVNCVKGMVVGARGM